MDGDSNPDALERGPNKRKIKPSSNPEWIHLDDFENESSSDSDFCIEDHSESDSDGASYTEDDKNQEEDGKDNTVCNNKKIADDKSVETTKPDNSKKENLKEIVDNIHICSVCLGDTSDGLIDCDECGISVHKGCYSMNDSGSASSSVSLCSTESWFCEPCKANVENPICELCPNFGGIFKETDCGKWVHLICALYIDGVTFSDASILSKVELFPNTTPRYGNKPCTLCIDAKFMCTGVTIACDAGMCRSHFHVTCAQREGSLSEVTSLETDIPDPFFAHCKLHVDKFVEKKRKRNWAALQLKMSQTKLHVQQRTKKSPTWQHTQQTLRKLRSKYNQMKKINIPKSPSKSKTPRPIITSASACRAMSLKARMMNINVTSCEAIEEQIRSLRDIPKNRVIPPAFSLEFAKSFLERNLKFVDLKNQQKNLTEQNKKLHKEQAILQNKYNKVSNNNNVQKQKYLELRNMIIAYHNVIHFGNPNANMPDINTLAGECQQSNPYTSSNSVHTPTTLKAGIGFSMTRKNSGIFDNEPSLDLNNKCGICGHTNDQHLLVKCDTCYLYYHLGCLNPPLARMPKKTKIVGWQCVECDKSNSNSELEMVDINTPRKLRYRGKKRFISESHGYSSILNEDFNSITENNKLPRVSKKKKHKRQRENNSQEITKKPVQSHKRKSKHHEKNIFESEPTNDLFTKPPQQGIKLFIKSIPSASGIKTTSSQLLIVPPVDEMSQTSVKPKSKKSVEPLRLNNCNICKITGTSSTMVQCDECSNNFHLYCLDPPLKKSPKVFGYSWHCYECDPVNMTENIKK